MPEGEKYTGRSISDLPGVAFDARTAPIPGTNGNGAHHKHGSARDKVDYSDDPWHESETEKVKRLATIPTTLTPDALDAMAAGLVAGGVDDNTAQALLRRHPELGRAVERKREAAAADQGPRLRPDDRTAEEWAALYLAQEEGKRLAAESAADGDDRLRDATRPVLLSEVEVVAAKWRIVGLMEIGWVTLLWAAAKTGKTTMIVNLAHSLLSGEPFLGKYEVSPIPEGRRIGILNYEMSAAGFKEWAELRGVDCSRVAVWNLRGMPNPLGSEKALGWLAEQIREAGVEYLIIDTYSRAMIGDNEDNNPSATAWFKVLGELLATSGATDALVTHHAGHNASRLRGASALRDNPDCLWGLTAGEEKQPDAGVRYLEVAGRFVGTDAGLPDKTALEFTPGDISLRLSGTTKADAAVAARAAAEARAQIEVSVTVAAMVEILREAAGPMTQNALFAELHKRKPGAVTTNRGGHAVWVERLRETAGVAVLDPVKRGTPRTFHIVSD